jgi:hypothetical protein
MKIKTASFILLLLLVGNFPGFAQTLLGKAAGDFFTAFARLVGTEKRLTDLNDLTPYIPAEAFERLEEDLVYRVAFIGFAANQLGVISGRTNSVGFAETLRALTGFLMIVEKSNDIEEWTIGEITGRYEQLLATSWRNVNSPLFALMLEAYCSYKRGELWQ